MTADGIPYPGFEAGGIVSPSVKSPEMDLRSKLIVALDVTDLSQARKIVKDLGEIVSYYKIGLELLFGGGLELAKELKGLGKSVFLDMKLLDIEITVEKAVANLAKLKVDYVTIHGHDKKTLSAAVRGRGDSKLGLLAVTVLTNLIQEDLREQGSQLSPAELVVRRAKLAYDLKFSGVIASGHEAKLIRNATSKEFLIKVPGIRLPHSDRGDQSRVMTPSMAISEDADYLVVGRPITQAPDRKAAAELFLAEIQKAWALKTVTQ